MREGNFPEGERFYWEKMHSEVENTFCKRYEEFQKRAYDWLIIPAGLVDYYYVILIRALKPKNVCFVCTKEFRNSYLDLIVQKTGLTRDKYITDVIDYDEMDLTTVYDTIKKHYSLFHNCKTVVDLTRGKRVMAAGAGIAAAFFDFDLVYIDEDWVDDLKRGLPGTEKLVEVRNPLNVLGDLENSHAEYLFNTSAFTAAQTLYQNLRDKVIDPRESTIKYMLAQTYDYWDMFNFKAAQTKLIELLGKMTQYGMSTYLDHLKGNLEALKTLVKIQEMKKQEILKNQQIVLHLAVDLYQNSVRRHRINRNDDALARLYRILELVSQHRLAAKYDIDTARVDTLKLKDLEETFKTLSKELYGVTKNIPSEVGLKDGHLLLYILRDALWERAEVKELSDLFSSIRTRDQSITAHGLDFVTAKGYDKLVTFVLHFLNILSSNDKKQLETIMKQHTFVTFG